MNDLILRTAGCITPLGNSVETTDALINGTSIVLPCEYKGLTVSLAQFDSEEKRDIPALIEYLQRETGSLNEYNSPDTLFIYAVAKGDISPVEKDELPEESLLSHQVDLWKEQLGLDQCNTLTISNACASGIAAVDTARDYLNHQLYKTVIIAGVDLISEFTVTGFHSLSAISPEGAKPFDKNRTGMTLGEGAGILVIEKGSAKSGDITVPGSATTNDANHRTGPSRDGAGLADAMNRAIKSAALIPSDIGAVKCHGTATPYNDAMEAKALFTVFGENQPAAVSLKGAIGHLSGAGSIVETVLSSQFLKRRTIPGTAGFEESDLPEPIKISNEPQEFSQSAVVVSAAGFGGLNSALILREVV